MNGFFDYVLKVPDYNGFYICLSFSAICLVLIIVKWVNIYDFKKNSEVVEGKISQLRRDVDDEVDFPTVSFHTLSGEYIEREHKTGLGAGMYSINQPVKVRYSVEDPYQFRINKGWEEQVEILFLFIFMVMALWIAFAQISD